ncbi:uncharacterized protein LOC121638027 [Melanotaenia boesemani]|uniref:uncharacterized protein LOC121638027 n=1 Tax=Melanotaenia boesemani TaxID=1250792 RepID=UPI001C047D28|nr:uncharacterized protein LOC121638027 [Melanotaenia boesemani]
MEHPTFKKLPNGTIKLKASTEAQARLSRGKTKAAVRAKTPEEVEEEARAHVVREGGDVTNATLVLSRWRVQFGRYQGQTFHWLLENDVGYSVNLVASHQKERERTGSQSPLMANKDALTRYSSAYPDFVEAVRFHRAFEEARVKALQPGQEGQALVGFGDFKFETLQSLYDSKEPDESVINSESSTLPDNRRGSPRGGSRHQREEQLLSWEGESPLLPARTDLGPCKLAGCKSSSCGHLQQLCCLHPGATHTGETLKTWWSLILADYVAIREVVLASPRLMAQTDIQLYELNQRTLWQWWRRRIPVPAIASNSLPAATGLSSVQVGQGQPFNYLLPEGPSPFPLPPLPPPSSPGLPPPSLPLLLAQPNQAVLPPLPVPRSTTYRERMAAVAAGEEPPPGARPHPQYTCRKCGQLKIFDTGHTVLCGCWRKDCGEVEG